ncbi:Vomeronasal type-1 receptor 90 [Sciurus carolinensis]|uniref:Vomeronasal type-1 receptor n=1 Tax=Sciurus carolinensis TaxID=30640 RepID=A0AA41MW42_SCICA|nr:Vomeronasal type-1 receptor 90 [Sciurus carolinensis]
MKQEGPTCILNSYVYAEIDGSVEIFDKEFFSFSPHLPFDSNKIPLLRYAFFSDVVPWISCNTILLLFHIFTSLLQHRLKPTDLTIGLLTPFHLEMLLIMELIATDVLLSQYLGDDIKYKPLIYLHRLLRGFSICATCQKIVPQMISLSPRSSCLANFKHNSIFETMYRLFLWVFFYMSISVHFSISAVINSMVNMHGLIFITESYTILPISYFHQHLFSTLGIFSDVSYMGLMGLLSGYTVTLL